MTKSASSLPPDIAPLIALGEGRFAALGGVRWLRRLSEEGRVPSYKVGGKVLLSVSEVEAYIVSGRRDAVAR